MISRAFVAAFALLVAGAPAALADSYPSAQCVLNENKSHLSMVVANGDTKRYACSATCKYTLAGERPLHTFDCNYALAANAPQNVACDIGGGGPNHFAELQQSSSASHAERVNSEHTQ